MYKSTDLQIYQSHNYLGFAFMLTVFDIFMFIIDYQFDQQLIIVGHLGPSQMAVSHLRPAAIWDFYNITLGRISKFGDRKENKN